jgi:hypothetical protein
MTTDTIERVAIADAGQTVFLRCTFPLVDGAMAARRADAERVTKRTGVHIVVLTKDMQVAAIHDEPEAA